MWARGTAGNGSQLHRLGEGLHATAGERPTADLDDEMVEVDPASDEVGHDLVGQGLAALDR